MINLVALNITNKGNVVQQALLLSSEDEGCGIAERLSCAERLKHDLANQLHTMIDRYEAAEKAIRDLGECMDHGADIARPDSALSQVFGRWLDDAIRSFEAAGQGIAHARIERTELHAECAELDRTQRMYPNLGRGGDQLTLRKAADNILESYDFDRLVEDLDRLSGALEEKGLRQAANRLANDLGLNDDYGREHPPKKAARQWVFSRHLYPDGYGGYGYRTREDLMLLRHAFEAAGNDAGLDGMGYAMQEIATVIGDARDRLPSRTKIGVGNAIEGVVYKEKLELKMSHEVGNGLLAFIVSHTSKNLIDLQSVIVGTGKRPTL